MGDYRRRRARRRVRQCNEQLEQLRSGLLGFPNPDTSTQNLAHLDQSNGGYVPMTSTWAPRSVLVAIFGPEVVLSPEEKNAQKRRRLCGYDNTYNSQSSLQSTGHMTNNSAHAHSQQQQKQFSLQQQQYVTEASSCMFTGPPNVVVNQTQPLHFMDSQFHAEQNPTNTLQDAFLTWPYPV